MQRRECEQGLTAARDRFKGPQVSAEDQQKLAVAWAEGRALTFEQAVAEALEVGDQG